MSPTPSAEPPTLSEKARTGAEAWRPATRAVFRFCFCYFALYCFPFPFTFIDDGSEPFAGLWRRVIPWIAARVLHMAVQPPRSVGSDSLYDWLLCAVLLILAASAALLWTLFDRKRTGYPALHRWIRLYVGLYVGVQMLGYGTAKAIAGQFPPNNFLALETRIGDIPGRFALLSVSMAASPLYRSFSGWVEVAAGALFFIPRAATVAALISCGAMVNVFALNLGYDIDVKLFSLHLIAMSLFVCAPDLPLLLKAIVFRQPVTPRASAPYFRNRWKSRAVRVAVALYGIGVAIHFIGWRLPQAAAAAKGPAAVPFYGVWNVEEFRLDGELRPPLTTDPDRWRAVIFDYIPRYHVGDVALGFATMAMDRSRRQLYWMRFDGDSRRLYLMKFSGPKPAAWNFEVITVQTRAPNHLQLDGVLNGHQVHAALARAPDFPLRRPNFRWIAR